MLIADINELKYQQEDAKKPNAEEEGEGKEDVTFLKLALKWVTKHIATSVKALFDGHNNREVKKRVRMTIRCASDSSPVQG